MSLGDLAKALSGSSAKGSCNCGNKNTKKPRVHVVK